jgi:phenylpropionate dioxygenase-like ring-hydroxylating dioxygenase large terminal subunit
LGGDGAIVACEVADRELVAWRDANGEPCVMDARCPHQWSHLAAEGIVVGDEIVCGAHFWRFDRTGHGSKVNVNGRRDAKADIEVFHSRERDGLIEVDLPT